MHPAAMTPRKGQKAWFGSTVPSLRATLSTMNFMQIAKPSMAPKNIPRNPPRHVTVSRAASFLRILRPVIEMVVGHLALVAFGAEVVRERTGESGQGYPNRVEGDGVVGF